MFATKRYKFKSLLQSYEANYSSQSEKATKLSILPLFYCSVPGVASCVPWPTGPVARELRGCQRTPRLFLCASLNCFLSLLSWPRDTFVRGKHTPPSMWSQEFHCFTMWRELDVIMLRKISQSEKEKYLIILPMWNFRTKQINIVG